MKANESQKGKYKFKRRIKFSLNKDELERRISDLDEAINRLGKLRTTSASLHDFSMQSYSKTTTEFAAFLQRVQQHANSLYIAIERRLACGCHHEHGTKFYLEGQSAVLQNRPLPINFRLALDAPESQTGVQNSDHEIHIEVLENNMDGYNYSMFLAWVHALTKDIDRTHNRNPSGLGTGSTLPTHPRLRIQ